MDFVRTGRFKKDFKKLDRAAQDSALEALTLYESNPRHPSLHLKKMEGTAGIWELRASASCRITFQPADGAVVLRRVGPHDILRRP